MASRADINARAASRRRLLREWLDASPGLKPAALHRRLIEERPDLAVSQRQIRNDIAGFAASGKNERPSEHPPPPTASCVAIASKWASTRLNGLPSGPELLAGLVATHLQVASAHEKLAVEGNSPVAATREMARHISIVFDLVRSEAQAAAPPVELSADEEIARALAQMKK